MSQEIQSTGAFFIDGPLQISVDADTGRLRLDARHTMFSPGHGAQQMESTWMLDAQTCRQLLTALPHVQMLLEQVAASPTTRGTRQ